MFENVSNVHREMNISTNISPLTPSIDVHFIDKNINL